jgi:hypothetical protein
MSETERALVAELVRLRHGWGLAATNLRERVGPHLVDICGILPADNDRAIRQKIISTVKRLAADFAPEDQLAGDIALGAAPGAQQRLLSDRVALLAQRLTCAERTARRRMDRAFERLAEEAVAGLSVAADVDEDPERGWYVRRFEGLLRLDTPAIELTETKTIVATRPGLKKIAIRFSLPPRSDLGDARRDLHTDISFGARIASREREGEAHFRYVLDLPRALGLDEAHTYAVVFRLPVGETMRPHYATVPLVQIESFQARVRFDLDGAPEAVWRFERHAPRILGDPKVAGKALHLDDAGEVVEEFTRLERGFGYGVAWRMPEE